MHGDGPARIGYATGWLVHALPEGRIIEHGGTTYGYTSAVRFDPDRRIGVIVLTNLAHQGGLAGPVSKYALDLIQGREPVDYVARVEQLVAARDEVASAPQNVPVHPPLAWYEGVYRHPALGEIDIRARGDRLVYTIGPRAVPVSAVRIADDRFEQTWHFDGDPDAAILTAPMQFESAGAQAPTRVLIGDLAFDAVRATH